MRMMRRSGLQTGGVLGVVLDFQGKGEREGKGCDESSGGWVVCGGGKWGVCVKGGCLFFPFLF